MENFEFLRDVTVGQYLPGKSIVHRMDPRVKMVALGLLFAAVTFVDSYLGNVVLVAVVLALIPIAGLPFGYTLRGIKPAIPFLAIFFVFQLLFTGNYDPFNTPVLWQYHAWWGPIPLFFTLTEWSLRVAIIAQFRLFAMLMLTTILTFTTTTTGLTHGIESLLGPFRRFKVPAHEIAMVLAIAVRFVPTLAEELEKLMKAQASRGADFGRRGRLRFIQQTRQLVPVMVPLFVGTIRRAEELIVAMESRCYVGGHGRTRLVQLQTHRHDWLALAGVAAFTLIMLVVKFPA